MADNMKMTVSEAFEYVKAKKDVSAGDIKKNEGIRYAKLIYPEHKKDKIDEIVIQYGQGIGYAKWQKHKYESIVSFPDWVHSTVTKGSDIPKIDNKKWFNRSYRLVDHDLNYNRTRMSQD